MKLIATICSLLITSAAFAQTGYEIKISLKPFKNQYIYLGHYYGKQLPIIDSVKLDEKSEGIFKGVKKLGGGIYLIGYPDKARNFDILVDKNQKFGIKADTSDIGKMIFTNSPENISFQAYQQFMSMNGKKLDDLSKHRMAAIDLKDSSKTVDQMNVINTSIREYRNTVISKHPNGLLATLLKGMKEPEVPANHPDLKKDSLFAYRYFKTHYWDDVNFSDDRLTRTPFFESRIDKYFEQLVYPSADSVIKEIDWMLSYASVSEEMQKFLLIKFVNRYLNQKYMWEDAVFVHLFEKYFAQKNYAWLNQNGKKIVTDRAYSLMANIFGSPSSDVQLPDTSGKTVNLYSMQASYTLLVIWDPTCGHCKEVLPKLDSMYLAKWKSWGLKPFALAKETDGNKKDWLNFIQQHKLNNWTHVYYSREDDKKRVSTGNPGYSQLFDVQSFPTLYLLDKDKRIIAKKITENQIEEILNYREKNGK